MIRNLIKSFSNIEGGFSARKLTAFALMVCVAYIHYKFVNQENAIDALIIDLVGVGFFLGLITVAQIINFKNGKTEQEIRENTANLD